MFDGQMSQKRSTSDDSSATFVNVKGIYNIFPFHTATTRLDYYIQCIHKSLYNEYHILEVKKKSVKYLGLVSELSV